MAKKADPTIQDLIADVHKSFGPDALADMSKLEADYPAISTGFPNVDAILGGGLPKGRLIELFGPEHSGKSTLAIHSAVYAQKDGLVLYVDFEHAFDPRYAKKLGLNVDDSNKFLLTQPATLEEGMGIAYRFIDAGVAAMVIVDSIAAGAPKAEVEGDEIGSNRIGLHSLVWANVLKKITHATHASNCIVLGVNQMRTKIGVTFGSGQTTPGGNAWKHYASQRIKLVKEQGIKGRYSNELGQREEGIVGTKVRVEVAKNKMARPFRKTTLYMRHGEGFDVIYPLLEEAELKDVIEKGRTGWYIWEHPDFKEPFKIRGAEGLHEHLTTNPKMFHMLEKQVANAKIPDSKTVEF